MEIGFVVWLMSFVADDVVRIPSEKSLLYLTWIVYELTTKWPCICKSFEPRTRKCLLPFCIHFGFPSSRAHIFTDNSFLWFNHYCTLLPSPVHLLRNHFAAVFLPIYFIAFRRWCCRWKTNSTSLIVFNEMSRCAWNRFLLLHFISRCVSLLAISGPFMIFMRNADQRKL